MSKTDRYPAGAFDNLISGTTAIVPYIDELLESTDVEVDNMRDFGEHVTDLNQDDRDFFKGLDPRVRTDYSALKVVANEIKTELSKQQQLGPPLLYDLFVQARGGTVVPAGGFDG